MEVSNFMQYVVPFLFNCKSSYSVGFIGSLSKYDETVRRSWKQDKQRKAKLS